MKKVRKSLALDVIDCSESIIARKHQCRPSVQEIQKVQKPDVLKFSIWLISLYALCDSFEFHCRFEQHGHFLSWRKRRTF